MKRKGLLLLCCLVGFSGLADVVHVFEQTEAGGATVRIADRMLETGRSYKTGAAPAKSGWIFTRWTISTEQDFTDRDAWGRAYDEAPFKLYEETTLSAHYLPKTQDEDGDGLADGYEVYWYGSTDVSPTSDTDGDGKVDTLDVRELGKLKSAAGRKWTENQLKAGDFNGNGQLDNADYQALRALLKEKGLL